MQLTQTWTILIAVLIAANIEILYPLVMEASTSVSSLAQAAKVKRESVTVPILSPQQAPTPGPSSVSQGKTTNGAKPKAAPNGRAGGAPTISPGPGNGASVPPEPEAAASYIQKLLDEPEPKSICDDPSLVSARSKISAWINKRRRIMAERAQLVSHRAEALQAKDKHVTETQFSKANTAVLDVRQTTDRIEQKTREHSEADAVVGKGQEDLVSIIFQVAQSKKEKASNLGQAMKVEHQVAAEASREKDSTADQHSVKHQSIVKWTAESEEWIESQEKALDTEKLSVQAQMTEAVAPLELDRDRSAAKALEVAAQIKELEEALAAKRKEMKETRDRHEALSRKVDGTRKEYKAQLDEVDRKSKLLDEWRNGVQRNWTLANEHLNSANEARKASQKILHNSFVLGNMTQQRVERLLEASEDYTCVANVKRSFEETIGRVRGEELKANGGVKAALERVVQETAAVERVEAELDRVLGDIARAEEAVVLAKKRQDRHMADRDRWIASGNYKNADKAETAIKFEADEADKASAEVKALQPSKAEAEGRLKEQQKVLDKANQRLAAAKAAAAQARYNTLWVRVKMAEANDAVRALEEVNSIEQQMGMDRTEMSELHAMYNITKASSQPDSPPLGKCDAVKCDDSTW